MSWFSALRNFEPLTVMWSGLRCWKTPDWLVLGAKRLASAPVASPRWCRTGASLLSRLVRPPDHQLPVEPVPSFPRDPLVEYQAISRVRRRCGWESWSGASMRSAFPGAGGRSG